MKRAALIGLFLFPLAAGIVLVVFGRRDSGQAERAAAERAAPAVRPSGIEEAGPAVQDVRARTKLLKPGMRQPEVERVIGIDSLTWGGINGGASAMDFDYWIDGEWRLVLRYRHVSLAAVVRPNKPMFELISAAIWRGSEQIEIVVR